MIPSRWAAFLVAALVLTACRAPLPSPDAGVALEVGDPRPARLLAALDEVAESRSTLRAVTRIAVDSEDLTFRATQRVLARRPAGLRVEVMGLFGQVAAVLTTDGHTFQFLEAGSPVVEMGLVTPDLLWHVARIDLVPEDAVGLLLGAPRLANDRRAAAAHQMRDGEVRVRLDDDRGRTRERLAFDPAGRLVGVEAWDPVGDIAYEARFDDFEDRDGEAFANRVELEFPRTGARATVQFRGVELNPELDPGLFFLERPERVSSAPDRFGGGGR